MEIKGKVHCLFEQSGTFKGEFIKLGIPAEDYDIQNNFGQTDHVIDLFAEIENAYRGGQSVFDSMTCNDLIMAFFPCTFFSDMSQILHTWGAYPNKDKKTATDIIIKRSRNRQAFYELAIMMLATAETRGLRLIMENPWGTQSYLRHDFVTPPAVVDKDRSLRGDTYGKPTAYWFINCENTVGFTYQPKAKKRVKKDQPPWGDPKQMATDRSMISPDYARNFIHDFILGKPQQNTQLKLF